MFDRSALAALSAVLDTGSFAAAADALNLTQPAISKRISNLEEQVGAVLIKRTRPVTATEAGVKLRAHAETLSLLEQGVTRTLGMKPVYLDAPLRIVVTADTLASWVLPALPQEDWLFYDLIIDDQDHSVQLLASGEAAGAITARSAPLPGCDVTPLGPLEYAAFASPAFLEAYFGREITIGSLLSAPALTFNRKDRLQLAWASALAGFNVTKLPTHYIGSTHGITEAARVGLGWAVNPVELVQPLFDRGELIRMRPEITLETKLFWQVPRQNKEVLEPLTNSLLRHAKLRQSS